MVDKSVARGAGNVAGSGDGGGGPASSYSAPAPAPSFSGGGGMMGELANAMALRKTGGPGRGPPPAVPFSAPAPVAGGGGARSPPPSMPAPMPGRPGMGAPAIPGKVCFDLTFLVLFVVVVVVGVFVIAVVVVGVGCVSVLYESYKRAAFPVLLRVAQTVFNYCGSPKAVIGKTAATVGKVAHISKRKSYLKRCFRRSRRGPLAISVVSAHHECRVAIEVIDRVTRVSGLLFAPSPPCSRTTPGPTPAPPFS